MDGTTTYAYDPLEWTASSTGAVSATLRYDPWGQLTASTGASLLDFRFQGSWHDTTTSIAWVIRNIGTCWTGKRQLHWTGAPQHPLQRPHRPPRHRRDRASHRRGSLELAEGAIPRRS